MLSRFVLVSLALTFSLPAGAQDEPARSPKIDDLETLQNLDRTLKAIDDLQSTMEKATAEKRAQCIKAIGHRAFCACIEEKSPVGIDFVQYVALTSRTKVELGYDKLTTDDKEMVDAARASREACVGAFNGGANRK